MIKYEETLMTKLFEIENNKQCFYKDDSEFYSVFKKYLLSFKNNTFNTSDLTKQYDSVGLRHSRKIKNYETRRLSVAAL